MTTLVDKAYIDSGKAVAKEYEESLRALFREAYGNDGDRRVNAMISKLQAHMESDSKDPANSVQIKR